MEAFAVLASTVSALIFGEALKEGGKNLGKGISQVINNLIINIRGKFKAAEIEGFLTKVERQPNQRNIERFEAELVDQMIEDNSFALKIEELVKQIEALSPSDQIIGSNIKAEEVKIEGVHQKSSQKGTSRQVIGKDIEATGKVVFRDISQESK
ncbi:hypothetical protein QGP82_21455 [Leptothoe sp. LEGE 181152]|nr:hypothetical protein [Leptothoe sp. LEGE 181152]